MIRRCYSEKSSIHDPICLVLYAYDSLHYCIINQYFHTESKMQG